MLSWNSSVPHESGRMKMTCQRENKDGKAGRTKHELVGLLWHFCCSSCSVLPDNTGPAVKSPEWAQPVCVRTSSLIPPILKAEVVLQQLLPQDTHKHWSCHSRKGG